MQTVPSQDFYYWMDFICFKTLYKFQRARNSLTQTVNLHHFLIYLHTYMSEKIYFYPKLQPPNLHFELLVLQLPTICLYTITSCTGSALWSKTSNLNIYNTLNRWQKNHKDSSKCTFGHEQHQLTYIHILFVLHFLEMSAKIRHKC